MIFHILTIFPDFFEGPFRHGVVPRAAEDGLLKIQIYDLRDWTTDRHRTVDDRPFGGGEGMLMKAEPIFKAVDSILEDPRACETASPTLGQEVGQAVSPAHAQVKRIVLLSAQGRPFDQAAARRLAAYEELLLICGRYEGVDERVAEHLADEELSVGDFVMSGGELAAAMVVDSVARLIPGVLGHPDSAVRESFSEPGLLDCPQYTRPADFRGWKVPDVLLNGNHAEIRKWREAAARQKTARNRPDLLQ
ncbi:MAG TPA: tRNA (guanosine(37)-N1)-methyltransferase TrmD [Bryobacteraceae bacterium]|nr:tRNA (guanosine(37)-N1)-methyltransferase TrmD [Bryobacteraceae bacterium]